MRRLPETLLIAVLLLVHASAQAADPPSADPTCRITPKLGQPLGSVVTVAGVVVEGPFKGYEGGPNLRVQRINGLATQRDIQIRLEQYFPHMDLPTLKAGMTVEMEGYETGGFVGIPGQAYERAGLAIQASGFYFSHQFIYHQARIIPTLLWLPANLVGQRALLFGQAVNDNGVAMLTGPGWRMVVDAHTPWEPWQVGKAAEAMGVVQRGTGEGSFTMTADFHRLSQLADQVGHAVSLRGRAWSRNGYWWFDYRGQSLHVEGMKDLPGWKGDLHGCPVEISGVLEEADLPDIAQYTLKVPPDLKRSFIVRKPAWRKIDSLLSPERDGNDY